MAPVLLSYHFRLRAPGRAWSLSHHQKIFRKKLLAFGGLAPPTREARTGCLEVAGISAGVGGRDRGSPARRAPGSRTLWGGGIPAAARRTPGSRPLGEREIPAPRHCGDRRPASAETNAPPVRGAAPRQCGDQRSASAGSGAPP